MLRFKLDENLGYQAKKLFAEHGYDADTVVDEQLIGATDIMVYQAALQAGRCLVTLDLDFADRIQFKPPYGSGVIVLRAKGRQTPTLLSWLLKEVIDFASKESPTGQLWIVEPGKIRVVEHGK